MGCTDASLNASRAPTSKSLLSISGTCHGLQAVKLWYDLSHERQQSLGRQNGKGLGNIQNGAQHECEVDSTLMALFSAHRRRHVKLVSPRDEAFGTLVSGAGALARGMTSGCRPLR